MKVTALDTETTGLEATEGHRLIEVCIRTYDLATRKLEDSYVQRIDPERNIPSAAQAVHGISYEQLVGCPKWEEVAPIVRAKLDGTMAIAHNMAFDGPFIGHELLRVGQPLPAFEPYCTMTEARWACPDGKYPKLGELCFALGVPYDTNQAHGAEYDVSVMMECFWRGLDRGFYRLPESIMVAIA